MLIDYYSNKIYLIKTFIINYLDPLTFLKNKKIQN
jgi:hypothetical protein